jgi:sialate O-acetylesterase
MAIAKLFRFGVATSLVLSCLSALSQENARVSLAKVFGDHMVIQRETAVPVWGWASPGDKIQVNVQEEGATDGKSRTSEATTDAGGKWQVGLPPRAAGGKPLQLRIALLRDGRTSEICTLKDVLVGDVWLCSGQSNMGFTINTAKTGKQDMAQSANSNIRLFQVQQGPAWAPQRDLRGAPQWRVCSPAGLDRFSAVAYYFGRDLQKHLGIPVGLVESEVGGTPAESWTSEEGLKEFPEYAQQIARSRELASDPAAAKRAYEDVLARWQQEVDTSSTAGSKVTSSTVGHKPSPDGHPRRPAVLFNAMINPLVPLAIKGVIWYQGESNASRAEQYQRLFPALIADWRRLWEAPNLPFLFVQLPYFHARKPEPGEDTWAELREAQLITFRTVPNTGMAITVDTGDAKNIHPADKEPVGARLAIAARGIAYGEKLEWSGPLFTTATLEGAGMRVKFEHTGSGLTTWDGQEAVRGFALAGEDHNFAWADAKIDNATNTVLVSSPLVPHPVSVRYAWAANPDCNLANKEGLPASPFRSDDWPLISHGNLKDSSPAPEW